MFIGEEDFKITKNYTRIINLLKQTLQNITFTNIIVCTPTYRYNYYSNMYNWRIKIFNNLLYKNVMTHIYAYLLDSNSNLIYDNNMFYRNSGIINNLGLNTIFYDIHLLINDIDFNNNNIFDKNSTKNDKGNSNQLFLWLQSLYYASKYRGIN